MNDMIIDADPEAGGAIATLPTTNLAAIITTPGAMDALLDRIERDARAIRAGLDISTEKGRKAIGSLGKSKVANAKVQIVEAANKLTEGWRRDTAAVVADRKRAEARLDALRDEIEAELVAFRAAKAATEKANTDALAALEALVVGLSDLTSEQIGERFKQAGVVAEFEWSIEFVAHAGRVQNGVIAQLQVAHQAAKERKAEAAAEAVHQAEETERQRLAAIEAQRIREAEIAAEATRVAEIEAARQAEEAARAARAALEAEAARAKAAEEREERLRQQAETARLDGHRTAIATMRKLAAPLEHPDPVPVIDAKIGQLADVFGRDWREFEAEAIGVHATCAETLQRHRAESVEIAAAKEAQAEANRLEAQRVRDEAAQTMAASRLAQEQQIAAERLKAALDAERQRVADERAHTEKLAADREKNIAHQRKVNGEIVADIITAMADVQPGSADVAKLVAAAVMKAMVRKEVRHCHVEY